MTESFVLRLTAQVAPNIHMSVNPSFTERTGLGDVAAQRSVPIITVREADTRVCVRQGETIVTAALLHERTDRRKTDLAILLTPTLVSSSGTR